MRAFITGITGFAGGFLAEHLLACGDEILGCSRRGQWPNWAGDELCRRAKLLSWDVGEGDAGEHLRTALREFSPDCIHHLAALSVPSDCGTTEPTERAVEVNLRGTERVIDLAVSLPRRPRLMFISTSHVYGKATRENHRYDEATPTNAQRAYGKTKLMAEEAVRRAIAEQGLDAVIVRAFQHTGPRQEPRLMLPEWVEQFADPSITSIRVKHLDTWIDLTDVRDVVRAYRLLAQHGERGGVYNVGSGVPRRTGDVLDTLIKISGAAPAIAEFQPGPEKFDPIADVRRLRAATGWQPEISLEQTVADTFRFRRLANPKSEIESPKS